MYEYSAVQINVAKGCVSSVWGHATFDHVYLAGRVQYVMWEDWYRDPGLWSPQNLRSWPMQCHNSMWNVSSRMSYSDLLSSFQICSQRGSEDRHFPQTRRQRWCEYWKLKAFKGSNICMTFYFFDVWWSTIYLALTQTLPYNVEWSWQVIFSPRVSRFMASTWATRHISQRFPLPH